MIETSEDMLWGDGEEEATCSPTLLSSPWNFNNRTFSWVFTSILTFKGQRKWASCHLDIWGCICSWYHSQRCMECPWPQQGKMKNHILWVLTPCHNIVHKPPTTSCSKQALAVMWGPSPERGMEAVCPPVNVDKYCRAEQSNDFTLILFGQWV